MLFRNKLNNELEARDGSKMKKRTYTSTVFQIKK